MTTNRVFRLAILGFMADLLADGLSAQCAMCKTALTESIEGQLIAQGMNRAIILLVAVPTLAVAVVAFLVWRSARRPAQQPISGNSGAEGKPVVRDDLSAPAPSASRIG